MECEQIISCLALATTMQNNIKVYSYLLLWQLLKFSSADLSNLKDVQESAEGTKVAYVIEPDEYKELHQYELKMVSF